MKNAGVETQIWRMGDGEENEENEEDEVNDVAAAEDEDLGG